MECVVEFLTSTKFLVNLVLGILLIEYALFKVRSPRKIVEERDSKYPAFRRYDAIYWTRPRLYIAAPYILPRFLLALFLPALYCFFLKVILIGSKRGQKNPAWKTAIFKWLAKYMSRLMVMVSGGLFFYKHERINKDYKKYLGPDWTPKFEGASSYVCNHSCWLDILICNFAKDFPVFTPKIGIKKWPVVGTIAE